MKRNLTQFLSLLLVCTAALTSLAQGRRFAGTSSSQALTETGQAALVSALASPNGEYAARAMYRSILDKFGADVLPYAHLVKAEENHIAALQRQCEALGVPVPDDPFLGKVQAPESLAAAAASGLVAEAANVKLYDELLPAVQDCPSLIRVFTNLQTASSERHAQVLQLAADNGGTVAPEICAQAGCLGQGRVGAGPRRGQGACLQQGMAGACDGCGVGQQRRLGQRR